MKENIIFLLKDLPKIISLSREKKIAKILIKKSLKIATAESCTGGLISSRLTDISGSSSYIIQNFVTYANEAKINLLGVNPDTINKYGVVSEEVALEMSKGLLKKYNCDIALATTGIAGPMGATDTKPVGLICISVVNNFSKKTICYKENPMLERRLMKYKFSNKALDLLLDFLNENYK